MRQGHYTAPLKANPAFGAAASGSSMALIGQHGPPARWPSEQLLPNAQEHILKQKDGKPRGPASPDIRVAGHSPIIVRCRAAIMWKPRWNGTIRVPPNRPDLPGRHCCCFGKLDSMSVGEGVKAEL